MILTLRELQLVGSLLEVVSVFSYKGDIHIVISGSDRIVETVYRVTCGYAGIMQGYTWLYTLIAGSTGIM